jgi:hypothetical protein
VKHEWDLFARALQEDRGLVNLNLIFSPSPIGPKTLVMLCLSLQTHPFLESINFPKISNGGLNTMQDHWMNRDAEMLQVNTVVQDVKFPYLFRDLVGIKIYHESVRPLLSRNKLRKGLGAFQKAPRALREKLLGRALQKCRMDPDRMWMLVSENVSDVFLSLRKSGAGERGRQLLYVKEPDASNTAQWQKLKERLKQQASLALATVIVFVVIAAIVHAVINTSVTFAAFPWLQSF